MPRVIRKGKHIVRISTRTYYVPLCINVCTAPITEIFSDLLSSPIASVLTFPIVESVSSNNLFSLNVAKTSSIIN